MRRLRAGGVGDAVSDLSRPARSRSPVLELRRTAVPAACRCAGIRAGIAVLRGRPGCGRTRPANGDGERRARNSLGERQHRRTTAFLGPDYCATRLRTVPFSRESRKEITGEREQVDGRRGPDGWLVRAREVSCLHRSGAPGEARGGAARLEEETAARPGELAAALARFSSVPRFGSFDWYAPTATEKWGQSPFSSEMGTVPISTRCQQYVVTAIGARGGGRAAIGRASRHGRRRLATGASTSRSPTPGSARKPPPMPLPPAVFRLAPRG